MFSSEVGDDNITHSVFCEQIKWLCGKSLGLIDIEEGVFLKMKCIT